MPTVLNRKRIQYISLIFTNGVAVCGDSHRYRLSIVSHENTVAHYASFAAAQAAGAIAKYYNIPLFSWAATAVPLADNLRYNNVIRVISSGLRFHDPYNSWQHSTELPDIKFRRLSARDMHKIVLKRRSHNGKDCVKQRPPKYLQPNDHRWW